MAPRGYGFFSPIGKGIPEGRVGLRVWLTLVGFAKMGSPPYYSAMNYTSGILSSHFAAKRRERVASVPPVPMPEKYKLMRAEMNALLRDLRNIFKYGDER
jgi:hypothetical protein